MASKGTGPTHIARKRILNDLLGARNAAQQQDGIHIWHADDNTMTVWALIIGPPSTPYEGGFYFIRFDFPNDYPFNPPKATFLTQHPSIRMRFHPNLYVEGKVCLSMLNTWQGPSWSSIQSLTSILRTIQSIMDDYPLRNEPSYESVRVPSASDHAAVAKALQENKDKGNHIIHTLEYSRLVEHANLLTAAHYLRKIRTMGPPFSEFAPVMEEHFRRHGDRYIQRAKELKERYEGQHFKGPNCYGNISATLRYDPIINEFQALRQRLPPQEDPVPPATPLGGSAPA